jgi:hypothetical protein
LAMATVTLRMNSISSQPNGKNQRVCAPCIRVRRAAGWLWRKLIADEDAAKKDQIRRQRIDNILHNVVLMEAMRRWQQESKSQEVSKDGSRTGE